MLAIRLFSHKIFYDSFFYTWFFTHLIGFHVIHFFIHFFVILFAIHFFRIISYDSFFSPQFSDVIIYDNFLSTWILTRFAFHLIHFFPHDFLLDSFVIWFTPPMWFLTWFNFHDSVFTHGLSRFVFFPCDSSHNWICPMWISIWFTINTSSYDVSTF